MARGALGRDPQMQMAKKRRGGAMAQGPGFQLATDPAALQAQQQRLQNRIASGHNAPKYQKRLDQVNQAIQGQPVNTMPMGGPEGPPQYNYDQINQGANQQIAGSFQDIDAARQANYLGEDFTAMQQRAQEAALGDFNRYQKPEFERQNAAFRQQLAEQGIPVGSKAYNDAMSQHNADQERATQSALDSSFQQGLAAQNQGFQQNAQRAILPYQQLGAFSPFYAGQSNQALQQGQQQFLGGQNQLDRDLQMRLQKLQGRQALQQINAAPRGGGGGGGLSYDQQLGLLDRQFYNGLVLQGVNGAPGQVQGGGIGNAFVQGIGAGSAGVIGSGLVR